jgi:GPH family glycoside/pentoside/hexuronide:cation symporter
MPFLEQIRVAFANGPFRFVVGIYLFSWLALQLVSSVLLYYIMYYVGMGEEMFPPVLLAIQGSSLIFLFIWAKVSARLDKRLVYIIGATIWLAVQLALSAVRPDQGYLVIPLALVAGAGVSVAYLIPWAMMPDVIELDEIKTHRRREGIFYGFMVLLQKIGLALGLFLVGWVLSLAGFVTRSEELVAPIQPESALNAIRIFMGPVPAVILLASLVLAYYYPITRTRHARMRSILARRQARHLAHTAVPVGAD